jgi:hypothetical protein
MNILNITENSEQILNILNIDWTESEHYWTFWTLTERSLNIVWKDWTFLTLSEKSELFSIYTELPHPSLN